MRTTLLIPVLFISVVISGCRQDGATEPGISLDPRAPAFSHSAHAPTPGETDRNQDGYVCQRVLTGQPAGKETQTIYVDDTNGTCPRGFTLVSLTPGPN